MQTPPAIVTSGLTKHYGDVRALVDLDLEVRRGEVFGFLGPNGAGKMTAIRVLTDEIRPTSGTANIVGLDCQRDTVSIRSHLGYLPGDLAMYPKLTGRETLTFFANLRGGVDWTFVDALADRLDANLSKHVGELSTGNRQKIGLIQAFMNRPDVIIMDEPSTGLDPLVQAEFQAMMREVAEDGRTVFLSSHTLSEVQRAADRVAIRRGGRRRNVRGHIGGARRHCRRGWLQRRCVFQRRDGGTARRNSIGTGVGSYLDTGGRSRGDLPDLLSGSFAGRT